MEPTTPRLPAALRPYVAQRRWVLWKTKDRDGKPTKIPVDPHGQPIDITNPANLHTFTDLEPYLSTYGLGLVLGEVDGDALCGIDIDDARRPDGRLHPHVRAFVSHCPTYTEWSPSRRGLHLIGRGRLPDGARSRFPMLGIEIYDHARFFTVTGEAGGDVPVADLTETFARLVPLLSAADAFLRATSERIRQAWRGDTEPWSGDESSRDFALATALVRFTNGDLDRADALFRLSGSYRPKWDERRGDTTYGRLTLTQALPKDVTPDADQRWSLQELLSIPTPPFLIKGLMPDGGITLLTGLPFAGKSTLAVDFAVSIAARLDAVGRFPVSRAAPVVYVAGERSPDQWGAVFRAVLEARGASMAIPVTLMLAVTPLARLVQTLMTLPPSTVIVLDPLLVLSGIDDENDAGAVTAGIVRPLRDLKAAGYTILALHHSAKHTMADEPSQARDLVRGSGAFVAMADSIIGLWRHPSEGWTKCLVTTRGLTVARPFLLTPGGQDPIPDYVRRTEQRAEESEDETFEAVDTLALLYYRPVGGTGDHPTTILTKNDRAVASAITETCNTYTALAQTTGLSQSSLKRSLKKLLLAGLVRKRPDGTYEACPDLTL